MDEYRFQVQLNWSRSQYLLTFNAALLAAATGLLKISSDIDGRLLTAGLFVVGLASATLSIFATRVQHSYYRRARDRMQRLEKDLGFDPWSIDTTRSMIRPRTGRLGKVTSILYFLFVLIAVINVIGVVVCLRSAQVR